MYNKTKRSLERTSAILSIVMGGLLLIFTFLMLLTGNSFSIFGGISDEVGVVLKMKSILFDFIFQMILSVILIVLGSLLCFSPKKENGVYKNPQAKKITIICIMGVLTLIGLITIFKGTINGIIAETFFMALIILVLQVVALVLKPIVENTEQVK